MHTVAFAHFPHWQGVGKSDGSNRSFWFQLQNDNVNTTQVSETIRENTLSEDGNIEIFGGDIITISDLLEELLSVHQKSDRETGFEENKYLTNNVLITTNQLFASSLGWEEIIENKTRYESSSNLLSVTDSAGFLLFQQSELITMYDYNFNASELNMKSNLWQANSERPDNSYCYKFEMSEICIPKETIDEINDDDVIEVSVEYDLGIDSNLFPSSVNTSMDRIIPSYRIDENYLKENTSLKSRLIGLAINNGTSKLNIPPDQPVIITFRHETTEVRLENVYF